MAALKYPGIRTPAKSIIFTLLYPASYKDLPDDELLSLYRENGNNAIAGILFERYSHLVFGVCMKYLKDEDDSRDMTMQVFEKLLASLRTVQVKYFKSWLYAVTKNECLMLLRSAQHKTERRGAVKNEPDSVMETSASMHHEEEDSEQMLAWMEKGLGILIPGQRTCIELFYLKEKCYREVAEITGYSMNEVKSYIQNGKRNLKNFIIQQRNEQERT